jgi:hypothetical protein
MNTRKKASLIDRTCDRIFYWAAGTLIESLPIVGPIYAVAKTVNKLAEKKDDGTLQ